METMEKFNRLSYNGQTGGYDPGTSGAPKPAVRPATETQEEDPAKKKKKNPYEITC
jgi:hypothetical protein